MGIFWNSSKRVDSRTCEQDGKMDRLRLPVLVWETYMFIVHNTSLGCHRLDLILTNETTHHLDNFEAKPKRVFPESDKNQRSTDDRSELKTGFRNYFWGLDCVLFKAALPENRVFPRLSTYLFVTVFFTEFRWRVVILWVASLWIYGLFDQMIVLLHVQAP